MPDAININGQDIPIEQFQNDWALALMNRGIIVRLSITRWRATTRLTPEMLGLKFLDDDVIGFVNNYISLGKQKLLPPAVMSDIGVYERRARNILSEYSFDTVWGRFVPYTAFDQWQQENEENRRNFLEAAQALGNRYDEIISIVRRDYRQLARDVWARLYPENQEGATDSFLDNFTNRVIGKIPPLEEIIDTFKYEVTYLVIPMPSFVESNIAKADEIRRNNELKNLESELAQSTRRRVEEEYVRRKQELIDGFLEKTVSELRTYVSDLCDSVLKAIGKQSHMAKDIPKAQRERIKKMIKKVRYLNFYEDDEVNKLLNDLDTEITKYKGERDRDIIVDKLQEIVDIGSKEFRPTNFNPAIGVLSL